MFEHSDLKLTKSSKGRLFFAVMQINTYFLKELYKKAVLKNLQNSQKIICVGKQSFGQKFGDFE